MIDGTARGADEPHAAADTDSAAIGDAGRFVGQPAIVWADECLVVIDKPSGMLAVPGRGPANADCASSRVQQVVADALVVHRLDMSTSGLMAMARGKAMQRALSIAFAGREVSKRYVAIVHGRLQAGEHAGEWRTIDMPIGADWPNRPRQRIDLASGKPSLTRYRIAPRDEPSPLADGAPRDAGPPGTARDTSASHAPHAAVTAHPERADTLRLDLEPVTGRTHQLRVHLAAIGRPIVGDALYGPAQDIVALPSERSAAHRRLLLHASELSLTHPVTGALLTFRSPAPF